MWRRPLKSISPFYFKKFQLFKTWGSSQTSRIYANVIRLIKDIGQYLFNIIWYIYDKIYVQFGVIRGCSEFNACSKIIAHVICPKI